MTDKMREIITPSVMAGSAPAPVTVVEHLEPVERSPAAHRAAKEAAAAPAATEAAATTEAAADPPATPKTDRRLATGFAALAKRDREIKAAETALAAKRAEVDSLVAARERAKADPVAALQELGWTYQQATEFVLEGGKVPASREVDKLRAEIKEGEAAAAAKAEAAQKAANDAAIEQFKVNIGAYVAANAETYELVVQQDAQDLVFGVIEEHFDKTGKVLSTADAATAVEKYLEAQADKLFATKKLAAKYAPAAPVVAAPPVKAAVKRKAAAAVAEEDPEEEAAPPEPKSVTRKQFTASVGANPSSVGLDRDARLAKAMSLIKFK